MAYNEVGTTAPYMTAGHWDRFVTILVEKLRDLRLSLAAELVEAALEETLTYYAFPEEHWRQTRSSVSYARSDGRTLSFR